MYYDSIDKAFQADNDDKAIAAVVTTLVFIGGGLAVLLLSAGVMTMAASLVAWARALT